MRHSLVQKIVKAYERYNESIGGSRQLSLKLGESAEPAPGEAEPEPPSPAETRVA